MIKTKLLLGISLVAIILAGGISYYSTIKVNNRDLILTKGQEQIADSSDQDYIVPHIDTEYGICPSEIQNALKFVPYNPVIASESHYDLNSVPNFSDEWIKKGAPTHSDIFEVHIFDEVGKENKDLKLDGQVWSREGKSDEYLDGELERLGWKREINIKNISISAQVGDSPTSSIWGFVKVMGNNIRYLGISRVITGIRTEDEFGWGFEADSVVYQQEIFISDIYPLEFIMSGMTLRPFLGVRSVHLDGDLEKWCNLPYGFGSMIVPISFDGITVPNSLAQQIDLYAGDILLSISEESINIKNTLNMILAKYKIGDLVIMRYYSIRDRAEKSIQFTF